MLPPNPIEITQLPSAEALSRIAGSKIAERVGKSSPALGRYFSGDIERWDRASENLRKWAGDTLSPESSATHEQRRCATAVLAQIGVGKLHGANAKAQTDETGVSDVAWHVTRMVLGQAVFHPTKFSFNTAAGLARAVAAYAAATVRGEDFGESTKSWWSVGDRYVAHNFVAQSIHGDVSYSQLTAPHVPEVQPPLWEKATFFEEVAGPVNERSLQTWQDSTPMLLTLLRYAEYLGVRDTPEFSNWRGVLEEEGECITNTCEKFGRSDYSDVEHMVQTSAPKGMIGSVYRMPIAIFQGPRIPLLVPHIESGRLKFVRHNDDGRSEKAVIDYGPEDLVPLYRATLKLFSRDRNKIAVVMGN